MTANPLVALLRKAVDDGYREWARKPHNEKWVRKIDGTPIPNDVVVCIQDEVSRAARSAAVPADLAEAGKLAYECFEAVSGEGPRAFDWTDKPHRLVYDMYDTISSLIATATAQAARIEGLEKDAEKARRFRDIARAEALDWHSAKEASEAALAASEAKLAVAVEALEEWDSLIDYQYSGSREAMSAMTHAMQGGYAALAQINTQGEHK